MFLMRNVMLLKDIVLPLNAPKLQLLKAQSCLLSAFLSGNSVTAA